MDDLQILEETEEGKAIAQSLKYKYWVDINSELGNAIPLKNKTEVTQRFYFLQGHGAISVDEAYRFMQNQWLEKQLQINRRQNLSDENVEFGLAGTAPTRKKQAGRVKSFKSNKKI